MLVTSGHLTLIHKIFIIFTCVLYTLSDLISDFTNILFTNNTFSFLVACFLWIKLTNLSVGVGIMVFNIYFYHHWQFNCSFNGVKKLLDDDNYLLCMLLYQYMQTGKIDIVDRKTWIRIIDNQYLKKWPCIWNWTNKI